MGPSIRPQALGHPPKWAQTSKPPTPSQGQTKQPPAGNHPALARRAVTAWMALLGRKKSDTSHA
ncbi:hypothetical protein BJV78DRAFT_1197333 [Lactifluus subvellereus]|nr:hypothetical protein BJV78DRAFT_1197333 [Lactifluus subvellereus]